MTTSVVLLEDTIKLACLLCPAMCCPVSCYNKVKWFLPDINTLMLDFLASRAVRNRALSFAHCPHCATLLYHQQTDYDPAPMVHNRL